MPSSIFLSKFGGMNQMVSILIKHNLRKTPIRIKVLEVFLQKSEALSHSEIEREMEETDRVTLYRTLKKFEESGIIHKALDGTDTIRYALCQGACEHHHHKDDHAHFNCEKCGKTFCLDNVTVPSIGLPNGYTQKSAHLIIKGTCELCVA